MALCFRCQTLSCLRSKLLHTRNWPRNLSTSEKGKTEQNLGEPDGSSKNPSSGSRMNVANIQMIPENQREALFKVPLKEPDPGAVFGMVSHLRSKGLWGFQPQPLRVPDIQIPELYGKNIDEHFHRIAQEQIQPYVTALDNLLRNDAPPMPKKWKYQAGWTKYENDGSSHLVDYPDVDALVFDVETCLSAGKYATLAAAVSPDHWYTWCSDQLVNDTPAPATPDGRLKLEYLIPLETPPGGCETTKEEHFREKFGKKISEKILVGHNVCFDRSYIREQYLLEASKMRFLDTMSLHIALAGFTTTQRAVYMKQNAYKKKSAAGETAREKAAPKNSKKKIVPENTQTRRWLDVGAMNNLEDVYRLHCRAKLPYDKTLSKIFVTGNLDDVRKNFDALMNYCANDVRATHQLTRVLVPKFREAMPHPVTFSGLLEMSSVYLPVNKNWEIYIQKSNSACDQIEEDLRKSLVKLAVEALAKRENEAYKDDLWLWDLDWSTQKITARTKQTSQASLPKWYRDLSKKSDAVDENGNAVPDDVSLRMRIVPKLMRLTWNGWPLHHTPEHGWGWLEPASSDLFLSSRVEKVQIEEKQNSKLTKSQPEAVFPVQKLLELAKKLGRSLPDPVRNSENFVKKSNFSENFALSEEDFDKLSDMTPTEQQNFFVQRTEISTNADVNKPRKVKILPPSMEMDRELSNFFSEDVELQEFQAKNQPWKPQKTKAAAKPVSPLELNEYLDVIPGCVFRRLTHSNGIEFNVGSPLSRDFLQHFESGVLKASFGSASEVIKLSKMVSYWHNNKDRIESQLVGHLQPENMPVTENEKSPVFSSEEKFGAILPRLAYMGTVTRRAVEATWMTASNAKPDRIGSELKAMIQAPPGYSIVGADVDSQELWIAAVLGDSHWLKEHGCTAFGWMTLQGNKADETDLHSKTATQAGVERDQAKILNYGRIYGAGREYAAVLLRNFNHDLTEQQANTKAQKIYTFAKGYRQYKLNAFGKFLGLQCGLTDEEVEKAFKFGAIKEIFELTSGQKVTSGQGGTSGQGIDPDSRREFSNLLSQLTAASFWSNGSESHMFNQLESIANSAEPRTPVLGCRISRCLMKENVEDDFLTSRANWVVQSSAVDYLHLMLVSMKWLMGKFGIRGRFCLSIHDEVRYLVEEDDRERAALALHLTNLLTRAMFAHKLGMHDLPQSIAFFSAVDVDTVIRKESSMDCVTPSNPEGLQKTYGIAKGEALDVFDALSRTGGSLQSQKKRQENDENPE